MYRSTNKVCAFDIDGILNNYPDCWVDFVKCRTGVNFKDLNDIKNSCTYAFYRKLKDEYRSSGYKLTIPARNGASELTQVMRDLGYTIVIITSRPFEKYPELKQLTRQWLRDKNIAFDDMLHSRNKHLEIISEYPNLEFMLEDNREFANQISNFGYKVFLLNNKYNQGEVNSNVVRIDSLCDII